MRQREEVFVCYQRCQTIRSDVLGDSEEEMKSTFFSCAVQLF